MNGPSEAAQRAELPRILYAQCWEDADVLLDALDVQPGDTCLSIASAGDNTLALLSKAPGRVIALDLNAAQLACLALRVAAYRALSHGELLELIGSRDSTRRPALYRRCRALLSDAERAFWDGQSRWIEAGIGHAGKMEQYFALFRRRVLPWIHSSRRIQSLFDERTPAERAAFHGRHWAGWRWRLLLRLFFSRFVMSRRGRESSFFRYAEHDLARHVATRSRHAMTVLDPRDNPYLQWIITGRHLCALPTALREENFDAIRANLDRLEWHCLPIETFLSRRTAPVIDRFNLSNIFEYVDTAHYRALLEALLQHSRPGSRLAYWNMLVPRSRPAALAARLQPLDALAGRLFERDRAFFYSRFNVEEVLA